MNLFLDKYFNKLFWLLSSLIFVFICFRAFLIPFSYDEAATFFFYVQSDNYLPYSAHVYTNNHVLNSALANICYHLFGSHRFVLRLPNIFAFVVLCIGIFKHFRYLKKYSSKLIVVTLFLLTFNFLDFFEVCRGYGLSFAFITLGMAYLLEYIETKKINCFLFFSVCWQLALSANLILVVVLAIVLFFVFMFQLKNKLLLNFKTSLVYCFNLVCLVFWIKFSFFYKEQGVLDYGVGDNYWLVTFKTLILFLFGIDDLWLQLLVLFCFIAIVVFLIYNLFKNKFYVREIFYKQNVYPILLIILIIAFYLLKKVLNVNYPEDRTGLFFYLFFVVSFAFLVDSLSAKIGLVISVVVFLSSFLSFILSFNFTYFSSPYYHTQPKVFFDYLKNEQLKSTELFTVGGHRVREMNYAFLNYRGNTILNPMDNSEEMQMNCDYYYALKTEKLYYQNFYDELLYDNKWGHVLLKRKQKINHIIFYATNTTKIIEGENEFFELKKSSDTTFSNNSPIEMEIKLSFNKVPKPFHGALVFSFNDANNEQHCYKRIALNWLEDDLNSKSKTLKLTTSNLPNKIKDLVVYIWNIDKQPVKISVHSLKLYQLQGMGVTLKIPKSYNLMIEKITHKPIL